MSALLAPTGTNAHIILEEAPVRQSATPAEGPWKLRLSARTDLALAALGRRYAAFVRAHPEVSAADFCFTASTARAVLEKQAVVRGATREELIVRLEKAAPVIPAAGFEPPDGNRIAIPCYPFGCEVPARFDLRQSAVAASHAHLAGLDIDSYPAKWHALDALATAAMVVTL